MPAPLLSKVRVLAAKAETTPGTPIALVAADGAFNVYDASIDPDIDVEEREGQGSFSPLASVPKARGGTAKFKVHLTGGAAAPSWASTFLPACGFAISGAAFAPQSKAPEAAGAGTKNLTIGAYIDGLFKQIHGAAGNAAFTFKAGDPAMVEFTFRGVWDAPSDVAIVAPTYPTTVPRRAAAMSLAIGAYSPKFDELTLDLGNVVELRENAQDVSGYSTALIHDRRIRGTIIAEATKVADWDPWSDWINGTERTLSFELGATGNKLDFDAPKLQIVRISEEVRKGRLMNRIEFQLNRSVAAGDDDLVITSS